MDAMEETDFEKLCFKLNVIWSHEQVPSAYNWSALEEFFWRLTCAGWYKDWSPASLIKNESITWIVLVLYFLYLIVFIVGLVGNLLVIYVVARFQNMRTITNFYLASLAIANASYLLFISFYLKNMFFIYWPFGTTLCYIYIFGFKVVEFACLAFLVVIAVDRYLVVCHLSKALKYRNSRNAIFCIIITWVSLWIFEILFIIPVTRHLHISEETCSLVIEMEQDLGWEGILLDIWLNWKRVVALVLSLSTLVVLYTPITKQLKYIGQTEVCEKSLNRLLIVVVVVYFICWIPDQIFRIMNCFTIFNRILYNLPVEVYGLVRLLTFVNSAANPILYAFLSDSFQKSFRKSFCCSKNQTLNAGNSISASGHPVGQTTVFPTSSV